MRSGTRPSLGPLARARRSSLCSVGASRGGGAAAEASRLGKLAQARGTNTGAFVIGRRASRRVPPLSQGRQRDTRKKRKEIEVSVPARSEELGFGCPHVEETQLQKSVGDGWPRISSANALQKERSGSSERGSSSVRGSAGDTVGKHIERKARRESARPVETVVVRRKAQGDERSSSSGFLVAESGVEIAGPGL